MEDSLTKKLEDELELATIEYEQAATRGDEKAMAQLDSDMELFLQALNEGDRGGAKPGPKEALTDTALELVAYGVGMPMSLVDSFINSGFFASGQERGLPAWRRNPLTGEAVNIGTGEKTALSVGWLLDQFKENGLSIGDFEVKHSGAESADDYTHAGAVAKRGADIVSAFVPAMGGQMVASRAVPLGERALKEAGLVAPAVQQAATATATGLKGVGQKVMQALQPQSISQSIQNAPGAIKNMVREALEETATSPGVQILKEGGAVAGAAQLSMLSEAVLPGDDSARIVGEVLGSFINPTGRAVHYSREAYGAIADVAKSFYQAGREDRVSALLTDLLTATGEAVNPEDLRRIAQSLRSGDVADLTAGQKTGYEAMLKLERYLARDHDFANESAKKVATANVRMLDAIDALYRNGDPASITIAASLEKQLHENAIDATYAVAEARAKDSAGRLVTGRSPADTGSAQHNILREALRKVEDVEDVLWGRLPMDMGVDTAKVKEGYAAVRAQMDPTHTFEDEKAIKQIISGATVKVGRLKIIRSSLLGAARSETDPAKKSRLSLMAQGIQDAMEGVPGYDAARNFTRAKHERFVDTFAGNVGSDTMPTKIRPEEFSERMMGASGGHSGGNRADLNAEEVRKAGEYAVEQGGARASIPDELSAEQADFLRIAAGRLLKDDGTISPERLLTFRKNNSAMLDRPEFAGVREQLSNVEKAQRALGTALKDTKTARADLRQSFLGRVTGDENPVRAIGGLLDGKTPAKDIAGIAKLAENRFQKEGLASAMIQHAGGEKFRSFEQLRDNLTNARHGEKSILDMVSENELLDADSVNKMRVLMDRAIQVEKNIAKGAAIRAEDMTPEEAGVWDFAVRVLGANVGSMGAASKVGAPMVASYAGSRLFRHWLEQLPWVNTQKVMVEAALNPQFMAALLERGASKARFKRNMAIINQGLVSAGIVESEELLDDQEED